MRFFNRPRRIDPRDYDRAIEATVTRLQRDPSIVAVYQLGGTSAPGISDLDILAVIENGARCDIDLQASLDGVGRYIFTHGVFGVSRSMIADALRYGVYAGLRHLHGEDLMATTSPAAEADAAVRRQTALEFLLMNYVARMIDSRYGAASVRSVLLSTHAIRFDLALLGVTGGAVAPFVARIAEWRRRWFDAPVSDDELRDWWRGFVPALGQLLSEELRGGPIALPERHNDRLARHIRIRAAHDVAIVHRGVTLPARLTARHKRYVRLQNRINRFHVSLPAVTAAPGTVLHRRFECFRRLRDEARAAYPRFTPLLNNFAAKVV